MPPTDLRTDALSVLERAVNALGGDHREGQQRLATRVADAIDGEHHLLAEAPTGSGKSLAYLAPVLASGKRAIIATATLALQDQLWRKDLPHLQAHAGIDFSSALLKGRSNYLCLAKLEGARGDNALFDERPSKRFMNDLDTLELFAAETESGEIAELPASVDPASWRILTCGPNECPGAARCEQGNDCFAELARLRAEGVHILVVNHALYCAHLASDGKLLPEHDVVIFDEAHALGATATGALGTDLAPGGLRQLAARLRRVDAPADPVAAIGQAADRLESTLDELEGRVDPTDPATGLTELLTAIGEHLAGVARGIDRESGGVFAAQAVRLIGARLEAVRKLQTPSKEEVVWIEGVERRSLRLAPIIVGPRLAPVLFDRVPTILLSATLGPGRRFDPIARQLGLDPVGEPTDSGPGRAYVAVRIESPFDHREQAMLYVPSHLPDVRHESWTEMAGDEVAELVDAAGGRALILCTSWRSVHAFTELLRERTSHTVLAQGEQPPASLIAAFSSDEASCLVATRAFWMGLDVPGPSCVLVVIDRLPFSRPDEPLEQARREAVERQGGDGFRDVDLPAAALVLAQGAGRLVRGHSDRGVVAVLDRRLATARYRDVLLEGLPPMRRVVDGDVARAFLATAATPV